MWVSICSALGVKKPAGTAEEIEKHFGCKSSQLLMVVKNVLNSLNIWFHFLFKNCSIIYFWQVGDRPFTDIVYGNRNGFLTILTEPLSLAEEPFIVKKVGFPFSFISSLFP